MGVYSALSIWRTASETKRKEPSGPKVIITGAKIVCTPTRRLMAQKKEGEEGIPLLHMPSSYVANMVSCIG